MPQQHLPDSRYAAFRLVVTLALMTIGSSGMYVVAVVLPAVQAEFGRVDVWVNNAGINIRQPIEEMSVESLDLMLAVNVRGPFLGIKHALPLMRKAGGGSIINMGSVCSLIGHKFTHEAYTTVKGALSQLTRSVAVRYAKDNIRANILCPSTVETHRANFMGKLGLMNRAEIVRWAAEHGLKD